MRIETERLILRPWSPGDLPAMHRILGNQDVSRPLNKVPYPLDIEWTRARLQYTLAKNNEGAKHSFALTLRESSAVVGLIEIGIGPPGSGGNNSNLSCGTLGYWLCKNCWGFGLMTEAGEATVEFGFKELGLSQIKAQYRVGNDTSARVLLKLGFTRTGMSRKFSETLGTFTDIWNTMLPRTDWEALQ